MRSRFLRRVVAAGILMTVVVVVVAVFISRPRPHEASLFEDVTSQSGVEFTYRNGDDFSPPLLTILESLGGGGATIDFDNDGRLDLALVGGGYFAGKTGTQILGHPCRLFRNRGEMRFESVTPDVLPEPAGGWFYSHGAAVADYDRDGWPDLLVTGWRRVVLYHNEPDGRGGRRFVDRTEAMGLNSGIQWATSAAWADLDGDGFPDLYLCQYTDWSFENHPQCSYDGTKPDICPPTTYTGLPHKLYRNGGGTRFVDVSQSAGLHPGGAKASYGLGVVAADLDGDGKPEVYAANDSAPNFLYSNQSVSGTIRLREQGLAAGVAVDSSGLPTGSMGVDVGDPEGLGQPALWVTNFENEIHAIYRNQSRPGQLRFSHASDVLGLASLGKKYVGWGTGFTDIDRDGWEDLFVTNGHAVRYPMGAPRRQRGVLLLSNQGKFAESSARGGSYFAEPHAGRGLILADLDDDGRVDAVVCHVNEPVAVLRNVCPAGSHWIGVTLQGKGHADTVGARVDVEAGGRTQVRFARGGGSYASSGDRRFILGLGTTDRVDKVTVTWPDRTQLVLTNPSADRYHILTAGQTP